VQRWSRTGFGAGVVATGWGAAVVATGAGAAAPPVSPVGAVGAGRAAAGGEDVLAAVEVDRRAVADGAEQPLGVGRVTRTQPWLAGPAGTLFDPWMAQPR
jgi:hypothetical protein